MKPRPADVPSEHLKLVAKDHDFQLARSWPRIRGPAVQAALFLTAAIGVSRVYLGYHWPTDVLASYAPAP